MPESLAEGGLFEELFGLTHRQRVVEPMYDAPREHGWRLADAVMAGITRITRDTRAPPPAISLSALVNWRPARPAPARTVALSWRSVCVRTCDGYFFPVAAAEPQF